MMNDVQTRSIRGPAMASRQWKYLHATAALARLDSEETDATMSSPRFQQQQITVHAALDVRGVVRPLWSGYNR